MTIQRKEPARLVALSDGLFATVLTLLVLDLRVPDALAAGGGDLTVLIRSIGPHFFSYLFTFLVAGNYWLAHHRDFDHIVDYDRTLLGYNLLFLLFVGLFPFSTALLSAASASVRSFATTWAIYAGNLGGAGIMLFLLWNYAASHHLISAETTPLQIRNINVRSITNPLVFLVSLSAQLLFPQVLFGPYVLLAIPVMSWTIDHYSPREEPAAPSVRLGLSERLWRAGPLLLWMLIIGLAVWLMAQ